MKKLFIALFVCLLATNALAQTQAETDSIEWQKAFAAYLPDEEIKTNYTRGLLTGLDGFFKQLDFSEEERTQCVAQLNDALLPSLKQSYGASLSRALPPKNYVSLPQSTPRP